MKLENNGKIYFINSVLSGGPDGWAETIMKNTLKAEQEEGNDCFLITDGNQWMLLSEETKKIIEFNGIPDISPEYDEDDY